MQRVRRWDVVTIGNLSRNRYWGEGEHRAMRPALCTCTLIQAEGFRLLVDPSLANAEKMSAGLDRRTGLSPREIDAVFITHAHGDHHAGLSHFPDAEWLAAAEVAEVVNATGKYEGRITPVSGSTRDAIQVIHTSGHTPDHHSLRFDCERMSVVVTGDAVMTRDFWKERRGYFNSVDFELAARTMEMIARVADIVVPGHDNFFVLPPAGRSPSADVGPAATDLCLPKTPSILL